MSDAFTDINRDGKTNTQVRIVIIKWLRREDYRQDLYKLSRMPRGYWNPPGKVLAKHILESITKAGEKGMLETAAEILNMEEKEIQKLIRIAKEEDK